MQVAHRHDILIVDDSQAVRESLGWLLQDETGLQVVAEATCGAEAMQLAIKLNPDVVILDIELPDIDGFAVTQLLKALPHPPIVILLSIHADAISKKRGALAGCDMFLEKGMTWPRLLERIQIVLTLANKGKSKDTNAQPPATTSS
jgi:two-component system, NarL family, response regulator LiaR